MNNYMMATTAAAGAVIPAGDFSTGLINDFIRYIDRGEKTTRTYIINLRQFVAWLAYKGIDKPTRRDIIAYRDYLGAEHDAIEIKPGSGWTYRTDSRGERVKITCKPNTVKQYLQTVRQFFSWTAAEGLYPNIAANIHAPKIRQDVHRKDALTAADVLTIENNISAQAQSRKEAATAAEKDKAGRIQRTTEQGKRLYAMYLLAVNCGLRTVEISRARVKDLEIIHGNSFLYVWGKGHTEADTKKALAPEVRAAIDDYLNSRTDKYNGNSPLFVSTGNRSGGQRIAETTISKMLKQALKDAGYNSDRLTAHSLRHSTAQAALKTSGGNIYTAQKYLRHASPATTEIYLHEDEQTERTQMETAQDIYNLYHGIMKTGADKLADILQRMTPGQLEQITNIAAAMV